MSYSKSELKITSVELSNPGYSTQYSFKMSYSGSKLRFDSQYWIIHEAKHTLIQIKLNNLSKKKRTILTNILTILISNLIRF
jgi:hypothetical protein